MLQSKILQFGTSRFLQAHLGLFVAESLAEGQSVGPITVVQSSGDPSRQHRLQALAKGYPVRIRGIDSGTVIDREVKVNSVQRGLSTQSDWDEIKRIAVEEAEFICSNTSDSGFDPSPDDSSANFLQSMSYPAKLMHILKARFEAHAAPIQIMPMELIARNGDILRDRVLQLATGEAFKTYLRQEVTWANSLVDRIVSEPIEPAGAVAEPYALWAVEDQPGLKLPCVHPDIKVVASLDQTEALKLFILNLGHSYLAENWLASGAPDQFVREILADPMQRDPLETLYRDEVVRGFEAAGQADTARAYIAVTLERFANPFLDHRISDISQNHAEKVRRRIAGFLDWSKKQGCSTAMPKLRAIASRYA